MIKVGDYVNKSGYKFRVMGISGQHADLRGADGQGDTIGEIDFLKVWVEPSKKQGGIRK